jgi:YD repeat-containing protein
LAAWNPTLEKVGAGEPPEVRYEYYPAGQLKKRIAPAGTAVEILYDQTTGRQKAIRLLANDNAQKALMLREAMTYDAEGFLVCFRDARGEIHQAEPDAFGRPLATRRPEDDLRRETLRDGLDRVIHERVFDSQKRLLDERKSHYDGSGRLVKVQRRRLATPLIAAGGQTNIDQ